MTIAEIIQIIIGVFSLIATVAVSIVIARVETKRAKRQHIRNTLLLYLSRLLKCSAFFIG